ncbi:MAG: hypothetical protein HY679_06060 [Chloroflexi bacterium]|nr:hypothetical protein [Chloroflexota bacterium]
MSSEPEKITIVEGPAPAFESTVEPWLYALAEGPHLKRIVRCLLRTLNGTALLERCTNAWEEGREVFLDYRDNSGLRQQALIVAARSGELDEGQVLQLWVRLDSALDAELDDDDLDFADDDEDGDGGPLE